MHVRSIAFFPKKEKTLFASALSFRDLFCKSFLQQHECLRCYPVFQFAPFNIGEIGLYTRNVIATENSPFIMVNGMLKHIRH